MSTTEDINLELDGRGFQYEEIQDEHAFENSKCKYFKSKTAMVGNSFLYYAAILTFIYYLWTFEDVKIENRENYHGKASSIFPGSVEEPIKIYDGLILYPKHYGDDPSVYDASFAGESMISYCNEQGKLLHDATSDSICTVSDFDTNDMLWANTFYILLTIALVATFQNVFYKLVVDFILIEDETYDFNPEALRPYHQVFYFSGEEDFEKLGIKFDSVDEKRRLREKETHNTITLQGLLTDDEWEEEDLKIKKNPYGIWDVQWKAGPFKHDAPDSILRRAHPEDLWWLRILRFQKAEASASELMKFRDQGFRFLVNNKEVEIEENLKNSIDSYSDICLEVRGHLVTKEMVSELLKEKQAFELEFRIHERHAEKGITIDTNDDFCWDFWYHWDETVMCVGPEVVFPSITPDRDSPSYPPCCLLWSLVLFVMICIRFVLMTILLCLSLVLAIIFLVIDSITGVFVIICHSTRVCSCPKRYETQRQKALLLISFFDVIFTICVFGLLVLMYPIISLKLHGYDIDGCETCCWYNLGSVAIACGFLAGVLGKILQIILVFKQSSKHSSLGRRHFFTTHPHIPIQMLRASNPEEPGLGFKEDTECEVGPSVAPEVGQWECASYFLISFGVLAVISIAMKFGRYYIEDHSAYLAFVWIFSPIIILLFCYLNLNITHDLHLNMEKTFTAIQEKKRLGIRKKHDDHNEEPADFSNGVRSRKVLL